MAVTKIDLSSQSDYDERIVYVALTVEDAGTAVSLASTATLTVPPRVNGKNLVYAGATSTTAPAGSALTINFDRVRGSGGSEVTTTDLLDVAITLAATETVAATGTPSESKDDVLTNDRLIAKITGALPATPPNGLNVVLGFL